MAIARFPVFVLDCPDPKALADFYSALLGWVVHHSSGGDGEWITIGPPDGSKAISFQRVGDYRAPQWPGQDIPQHAHLDVDVDDLDAGERAVLELGATKARTQPGESFRVFLDPAGHPFCLCLS